MDATVSPFAKGLDKTDANYAALSPLSFLARAADVFPDHTAIIHGKQRTDYRTFYKRSKQLASALSKHGIGKEDTVSVMLSNVPPMLEAHYGVPMTKAVLHSLNTRLDAAIIAFQLDHANCKVLITDREYAPVMKEALELATVKPTVIDYSDPEFPQDGEQFGVTGL
jgi:fatty-acyl-CoA synthase